MWKSFSGPGALSVLGFSICIRRCAAALQVTTNITGSEIDFKERLQIQWSGGSSSKYDVGVQEQSESGNGNLVTLSGGNTGSSLDWDFGYDFDVGTYAFVVSSTDEEAQSPLYSLLDPHIVSSTASSSSATSSSASTPTTSPTTTSTSASESSPTTEAAGSDAGSSAGLSTGAAIGVGVGVGVVSIALLGALLLWMYRRGKKAAAAQPSESNKDPGQGGYSDHWGGKAEMEPLGSASSQGRKLSATILSHGLDTESGESRGHYSELQHTPVYSEIDGAMYNEIGGAPRSELHSESVVKAELPPDAEVQRARGRHW